MIATVANKVKREIEQGVHPVGIMARYSLDSRQLAQILSILSGARVPAYCLPESGLGVRHYLPVFQKMGHYGLPRAR